jgi:large subunit ribosomal protein L22
MDAVSVAKTKHLKMTARKLRLVVDTVRGRNINEALHLLAVNPKKAAKDVSKTLNSAIANVQNREDADTIDVDNLFISEIMVDEGSTQKRWMPRAMGRASQILKRTSHLTVRLGLKK